MDVRELIRTRPMGRFQVTIIGICFALCVLDGFEILIMPFIAPFLADDWGIGPVEIGYLLSSSIIGTALGAIAISPLADRIGRRLLTILCLAVITVGMILSPLAGDTTTLMALRVFTGLGLGGIVSNLNILVSEYSSDRRRGTALGLYGTGLPLGSAIGGAATTYLSSQYGWRSVFVFAAVVTAVLPLAVVRWLPESVDYLVERRPRRALARYNSIGARLGAPGSDNLPEPAPGARHAIRTNLFRGAMLTRTVYLWGGYSLLITAFYFANTWTPKLLTDATGDVHLGARAGILVSVGGIVGALIFAALASVVRPRIAAMVIMFVGAVSYVAYAASFHIAAVAVILAVFVGISANGGMASFYAISPSVYPAASRATGVGWMVGCGRTVAIVAPILTGYLLDSGWKPEALFTAFGLTLIIAGVAVWCLDHTFAADQSTPSDRAFTNAS